MSRELNRKILGSKGIEFIENVDIDWKPEAHIAMLQEGLLDFVKVIPQRPQYLAVRASVLLVNIKVDHKVESRDTRIFPARLRHRLPRKK